jgi:putative transposase
VKPVANVQLTPMTEQAKLLRDTLECCNAACNAISQRGFEAGAPRQYALQKLVYHQLREEFGLRAQAAIGRIACTTQKANGGLVRFRMHAAQPYDDRIFLIVADDAVSIWTLAGRRKVPFARSERPRPDKVGIEDVLGVDFGVVNIAYDSERRPYSGADVVRARPKFSLRGAGLQRCGSKAAKRRVKKLRAKESRLRKRHCLCKEIVATAERSSLAIAIEDLPHVRKRVKARTAQRHRLHGWSFAQLRQFVTYKAAPRGMPVVAIAPDNARRACPQCGSILKANRKTQQIISCIDCGHSAAADFVGARNIRAFGDALVTKAP